mgnify:CR=1 FL=1
MKKQIQKGLAFSLLAAMAAGSALQVNAVEIGSGSTGNGESTETTVTFKKELTLKDVDDSSNTPQTPGVTFNYTITDGQAGTETVVHDGITEEITYKAGVGNPKIGTAEFTKDDVATSKNGKQIATENVSIDFSGVTFDSAGIYRYLVTETGYSPTDSYSYTQADIPNIDANNNTRNLDVYVNKKSDGTYYISGYVLTRKENGTNTKGGGFTEDSTPIYDENGSTTPSEGKTATASSVYYTHDISLSKAVEGDMINADKQFNFTVALPNQENGSYELYKGEAKQNNTTGESLSLQLKKDEKYTIKGLPISSTLTITEDDYSSDGYADPTATKDGVDETVTSRAVSNIGTNNKDNDPTDIVVTNHRTNTPPTGILWTIAPYAAMVGLAALLGVLFIKRRRNDA